jgi:hypothetical protein
MSSAHVVWHSLREVERHIWHIFHELLTWMTSVGHVLLVSKLLIWVLKLLLMMLGMVVVMPTTLLLVHMCMLLLLVLSLLLVKTRLSLRIALISAVVTRLLLHVSIGSRSLLLMLSMRGMSMGIHHVHHFKLSVNVDFFALVSIWDDLLVTLMTTILVLFFFIVSIALIVELRTSILYVWLNLEPVICLLLFVLTLLIVHLLLAVFIFFRVLFHFVLRLIIFTVVFLAFFLLSLVSYIHGLMLLRLLSLLLLLMVMARELAILVGLLAMVELVANALVSNVDVDNVWEPVVVTINLQTVCDDVLNSVVVAHALDAVYNCMLASRALAEHFVIVASDQEMRNCVSASNLDLAVVAAQNEAVSRFHQGHRYRMVWNVDWVILRRILWLTVVHSSSAMRLLLMPLWKVHIWRHVLAESSEILMEVYTGELIKSEVLTCKAIDEVRTLAHKVERVLLLVMSTALTLMMALVIEIHFCQDY